MLSVDAKGVFPIAPTPFLPDGSIDVSSVDKVTADARLPTAVRDALAADSTLEVVEHNAVPINFACPNVIVQSADGTRTGISDAASPWSGAVAQA